MSGWQLTLSAVVNLWPILNSSHNFEFLLTRRLNQDSLENLFSVIRQRGGNCDNPTSLNFSRLFKQVCCNSLFRPVAGSNCELDSDSLLAAIASHEQKQIVINTNTSQIEKHYFTTFPNLSMVCNEDSNLEDNGLSYVCGYFLRRLLKWHSCQVCDTLWIDKSCFDQDSRHTYTACRIWRR